ncbi:Integrin alpha-X CD11 antigen-like family member C [Channa argus]|uniref:Integrin alpha-X CD11 antigen-like family member C n=1 Tax=Channa argus TaxID=215402 RepID=A0A6G1QQ53_CHAAH|nr:Integrin alpha-X CD11 antigen-like family member C [Channa argus]
MDWIITTVVFLSVVKAALCFNIEPAAWKTFNVGAKGFGYQVVQRRSDLLVSAPLEQYSKDRRGQIYRCSRNDCNIMNVQTPDFAVNMSLGLTMTSDPNTQKTLACGPTIPKDCRSITLYNGVCFQIDPSNRFETPVPFKPEECRDQADIAFLLDGSGSVSGEDFQTMKDFVKNLVRSFLDRDTKFAIAQFSATPMTHYYFDNFYSQSWETKVDGISQLGETTYTAKAIQYVVNNIFTPSRGSRSDVKKILIVITDGQSHDRNYLQNSADAAEKKQIVRFAIGVGGAFYAREAKAELDTIASNPKNNHVFQVANFNALEQIRQSLQAKIFSIEGSQTSGESLKMEMAQQGFSAAYVPGGFQMGIVGANQWKGGYLEYTTAGSKERTFEEIEPDSYLGYSMAVAETSQGQMTIAGAPRYQHMGAVFIIFLGYIKKKIEPFPWQFQSGEYFGAEVCAMNVDNDRSTDLILISAPMYKDTDREGRVYICRLSNLDVDCHLDSPSILRGDASDSGRFGSSLAVLPDLNTDGLNDLAVGAPLENNGEGSIYIFHGEGGGRINTEYSQRISASEVQKGLKFFGMSISQTSYDQSGDSLPDLAVGSKGAVFLLRSRPIVMVEASVTFTPNQIPTQNVDCSKPLSGSAQICFTMTKLSQVDTVQANINYTFTLDATRKVPNNRAYVTDKEREMTKMITISLATRCSTERFSIQACPEDALNELKNELSFTFDGLPSGITQLKPSLAQQAKTTTVHSIGFEINCGTDNKCVDNLKVDFNFSSSSVVKVGIDDLLDVTVSVENRNENSYNSRVILTYPAGLSYRKFTSLTGKIECNSLDSEGGVLRGKTDCTIDKPIFKSNSKVFFIVSYGIDTNSELERTIFITANATSGNQEQSPSSELYKRREIDVKYSIFVTFESSLSYSNFSFGSNNLQKPAGQSVKVTNNIRLLNFTVVIKVPVKLGDKDIWVDPDSLQIPDCQQDKDQEPVVTNFVTQIQKMKSVDCFVSRCRVFKCNRVMGRLDEKVYKITANLSSGWIEQIGLSSAKFILKSTVSMEYDTSQYIFFSTGSNNSPPVHDIEIEVEVYPKPDFTKEIVGGSLGGLALLALLTAGLYKAGFFKSKYGQMISEAGEGAGPGADGGASASAPEAP